MDTSTSEDDPSSARIRVPEHRDVFTLSSEERKAAAPTISGVYENLFLRSADTLQSIDLSKKPGKKLKSVFSSVFH